MQGYQVSTWLSVGDVRTENGVSDFSVLNVYQMYIASKDNRGGVWMRRTTWGNLCARIRTVGPLKGPEPYYGNPEVRADIYTLDGTLHQANAIVQAPGTYKTWRQIETPSWWKE
jgi:hypothetical protein